MHSVHKVLMGMVAGVLIAGTLSAGAEVTPDDLIRAVDQMSPEQVQTLQKKLDARMWNPVPEGFFTRMALNANVSISTLDRVNLSSLSLSGGKMDIDDVAGFDFALLWRVFDERFRMGVRFGGWEAMDSNLNDAGYSSADVTGFDTMLVLHYQVARSEIGCLWSEIAIGGGSVEVETVDTPAGQATTLRRFDEDYAQAEIQVGASIRLNSVIDFFISGGYRFAESVDLEEGGRKGPITFDASGVVGRMGVGLNF